MVDSFAVAVSLAAFLMRTAASRYWKSDPCWLTTIHWLLPA
jgi:hypothetical protein